MPRYASSETDDSILGTDDEINEFEQAAGSDEEAEGVAQWEPDAWNEDEDDEDEDDDNQSDENMLRKNLSTIPLSTLAKARTKLGRVSRYDPGESSQPVKDMKTRRSIEKRESKNAPTAISSKKQVSRLRQVVDLPKDNRRDPRFSTVSAGNVDMHLHEKGYNFLPQLLSEEFASLKTALTAATKAERTCSRADKPTWAAEKERLERQLAQTRTRLERTQREAREREVLARAKKDEREKRKDGKGAWHLKKSAQRDLLLQSKFHSLESSGGKTAVKRAIEKKRRKMASKEKKSRPRL